MLPVDLAANAASLGADVLRARTAAEFTDGAVKAPGPVRPDDGRPRRDRPAHRRTGQRAWWDVPVAEVAELAETRTARSDYEKEKRGQRWYL